MEEKLQYILESYKIEKGSLIGLLQDIQDAYGYLPEEQLLEVSQALDIPLSRLFSLATFYTSFRLEPMGEHHLCICIGTACHVRGATAVVDTIERELQIKAGETTQDMQFTVDTVNCLGACALAPLPRSQASCSPLQGSACLPKRGRRFPDKPRFGACLRVQNETEHKKWPPEMPGRGGCPGDKRDSSIQDVAGIRASH